MVVSSGPARVMPNQAAAAASKLPLPRTAPLTDPSSRTPTLRSASSDPMPPSVEKQPLAPQLLPPLPPQSQPSPSSLRPAMPPPCPPAPESSALQPIPPHAPAEIMPTPTRSRVPPVDVMPEPESPAGREEGETSHAGSAANPEAAAQFIQGRQMQRRRSTPATQQAYRRLAQERCAAAMARAKEQIEQRERRWLPPGVWWGFHFFWPDDLLYPQQDAPLEDPEFLQRVVRLMSDEHMVDTFAIFDADGSGSISSTELEGLVKMLVPNPSPHIVQEMVRELDMNSDGEIDLWEFCVHMQKRSEGLTRIDLESELDAAFGLFERDANGDIGERELRRLLMDTSTSAALREDELQAMLDDLASRGLDVRGGRRISLRSLRQHPCYQVNSGAADE